MRHLYRKDISCSLGARWPRSASCSPFSRLSAAGAVAAETTILNSSYDVSRELYKEINPAFAAAYKKDKSADVVVNQSHGGSTKQAQAVANGLEADVVTFNQSTDIEFLADKGLVAKD